MTRVPKERRPLEVCRAERSEPTAGAPLESRAPGSAPAVQRPYDVPAVCGLLLLAVVLVFGKTVLYDFVNFDDPQLTYANSMVTRGSTVEGIRWALTTSSSSMWYPLTWISYMLDYQMYGIKPWGYHLTNVLLHAATTVILFIALRRMTGNLWASALAALLFAIHPLRAEAVAWVGERKSPLSGLFFVSTIAAYVAYVRRPFSLARYLVVAGVFTLGLMAKPSVVTLPVVLLLLDYWPLGRTAGMRDKGLGTGGAPHGLSSFISYLSSLIPPWWLVVEKIPLVLLAAAGSAVAVWSQGGNVQSLQSLPVPTRVANAMISYMVYLGQFFWPVGLQAFYPRSGITPAWQVGAAAVFLVALSVAALLLWRKQPALLVGWLWYLGTLAPMIGLVAIGAHARADRYTYLPDIGLCIAFVWGLRWAVQQLFADWPYRGWLRGIGGTLLVVGLMACAWRQTACWQDAEQLWRHALACNPQNWFAHGNLGMVLGAQGRADEAIVQYRQCLEINPDDVDAHNNFANVLASHGQVDEAIAQYMKALELRPDFADAYVNLGNAVAGRGQMDAAMNCYRKALELKPDSAEVYTALGNALVGRGQLDEAIAHYQKALEIMPIFAEAHNNYGLVLAGRGQAEEAIAHYRKALETKPNFAEAHNYLGLALAGRGQVDEALAHYRKALEIKPDYAKAHINLADSWPAAEKSRKP